MPWFRVTFRGPEVSPAAREALATGENIGLVHDRQAERHDPEHHTALIFADTGEAAIDIVMTASEPHGNYNFFEAFTYPPEGTIERL